MAVKSGNPPVFAFFSLLSPGLIRAPDLLLHYNCSLTQQFAIISASRHALEKASSWLLLVISDYGKVTEPFFCCTSPRTTAAGQKVFDPI